MCLDESEIGMFREKKRKLKLGDSWEDIWDKVFKNGPSQICGRQPLKYMKWYGLLKHCGQAGWSGKPWKPWKSEENNTVVIETLEKSGNFINISWQSGNNYMELCLRKCYSNYIHVLLKWMQKT